MKKFVFALIISVIALCGVAFAAEDQPVATLNGLPYDDFVLALNSAQPGDRVVLLQDFETSYAVTVRDGVRLVINDGVSLSMTGQNGFANYGTTESRGVIYSENPAWTFTVYSGNVNLFGGLINNSRENSGTAIRIQGNSTVNIYGGRYYGWSTALSVLENINPYVNIWGGTFANNAAGISAVVLRDAVSAYNPSLVAGSSQNNQTYTFGGLTEVGQVVSAGISWIDLFVNSITSMGFLLFWVVFVLIGTGIGLIKRIKS